MTSDLFCDDMNLSIRLSKFGIKVDDDEMFSSKDADLVVNTPEAVEFLQVFVYRLSRVKFLGSLKKAISMLWNLRY